MEQGIESVAQILEQACCMKLEDFDPRVIIKAVNALQPRGKDRALSEIEQFIRDQHRSSQDTYSLFWILRVLFHVPKEDGGYPPPLLGAPNVPPPPDVNDSLPQFPIVMVLGAPLLVIRGYWLSGKAEPVERHVEYFKTHGVIRAAPLVTFPPGSTEGMEDAFVLMWRQAYERAGGTSHLDAALKNVRPQIEKLRSSS